MAQGVWGIDISRYSIKAVRLERTKEGILLTAMDVVNIPGSTDIEHAEKYVLEGLIDLKKRMKIGSEPVACSMPGHSTFNRIIKLPPVEEDKMAEIVKYEAQSQIPFPLEEVIWDFQKVERQYLAGEEQEVMLFAVKREIVENFVNNIEGAMLSMEVVQFAPVAMYNFLCFDLDPKEGIIALDFGADNTDLLLTDGSRFWIRNIPVTGNQITEALAEKFKKTFAEAERIKRKAAQSKKAQALYAAMQPVYSELASEIHRSLGYFKSVSRSARFEKAILMGNGSKALNFQRFISQNLRMPAGRIQKLNKIMVGPSVEPGVLASNIGSIGTALGLALQGVGEAKNNVNLIPVRFLRAKQIKKKEPVAIMAAVMLLATAIVASVANTGRLEGLERENRDLAKVEEDYNKSIDDVNAVKDLKPQMEALLQAERIYAFRDYFPRVMKAVNANIPKNGDPTLHKRKKIYILSWGFKEHVEADLEVDKSKPFGVDGRPIRGGRRRLPGPRKMVLELEAAVDGSFSVAAGVDFIKQILLNWNATANIKLDPNRPSAVQVPGLSAALGDPRVDPMGPKSHLYPSARGFLDAFQFPDDMDSDDENVRNTSYRHYKITITYSPTPAAPPAEGAGG